MFTMIIRLRKICFARDIDVAELTHVLEIPEVHYYAGTYIMIVKVLSLAHSTFLSQGYNSTESTVDYLWNY